MPAAKNTGQNSSEAASLLGANSQIAAQLRAFYTGIQEEAIPQKFLLLLERLDAAEQNTQAPQRPKPAAAARGKRKAKHSKG